MERVRLRVVWLMMIGGMVVLLSGLWRLQMNRGSEYFTLSEENRIKLIPLKAPRGIIYDRHGRPCVRNQASFNVMLIPEDLKKHPQAIVKLADLLQISTDDIWQRMRESRRPKFVPLRLRRNVPIELVHKIEENAHHLPGIYIDQEHTRRYVYGDFAAHYLGYVGRISPQEIKALGAYGYDSQDFIGKDGVEYFYDRYLQGRKGGEQVEVTAAGRHRQLLGRKEPLRGNDLVLTLDVRIQQALEKAFEGYKGAAVATDPETGEILGMVSKPGFDPNIFTVPEYSDQRMTLLNDTKQRPLLNRAITGMYPQDLFLKLLWV